MDVPWLFLSHSGAQKSFTSSLYQELLHVRHSVFFDQDAQDSLPRGQPYPPRIVQACRGCRRGIVVLSHEYIESLWPMLELQELTFNNPSSQCILYPLFYKLRPADLSNEDNLRRWQATWKSKSLTWQSKVQKAMQAASTSSASQFQISLDISSWVEALEKLRFQAGDEIKDMDDYKYIKMVVSNICKTIPPPPVCYFLDQHIRGMDRLQEDIDHHFQQAGAESGNSTSAVCLGIWGLGGSGKTTLCMNMANFYRAHFPGRSYLLELPTEKDKKQLVEAVKELILELGRADKGEIERISSVEKIMSHLEEGLKGRQVFLAIDNVWDWTIERAYQIVLMACTVAGSKILVSSRSKLVLEKLRLSRIVPVPGINEDEAAEVLKSLSFFLPDVNLREPEEYLKWLARLCSFDGQCHPLLLKMMGNALRHRGVRMNREQGWEDLISRLLTRPSSDEENTILEVIDRSFLALSPKLQNTFIDLVTCTPTHIWWGPWDPWDPWDPFNDFKWRCKWLSMISDGFTKMDMRNQLIELEYHGLLEIKKERQISIHDLHKSVARRRAAGRDACLFEGRLSDLSIGRNPRYIKLFEDGFEVGSLMRVMRHCSKVEILDITAKDWASTRIISGPFLSVVSYMQCLRFLEIGNCESLEEIKGWEGTPNLVSLKMRNCISLQKLGDMGCLQKLENLEISKSMRVPDLTQCSELKKLEFSESGGVKHLASLGQPPKLKKLNLSGSPCLEVVRTVCPFTALQKLNLSKCDNLKIMEGILFPFTNMEKLDLSNCRSLQRIPDFRNLARLKVFNANGCHRLKMVKLPITCSLQVLDLCGCPSLGQLSELPSGSLSRGLELALWDRGVTATNSFINLQKLQISGDNCWNASLLNVSDLTSLIRFEIFSFPALQEIQGLDALPKLEFVHIKGCSRLERFLASDVRMSSNYQALGDSTPLFPTCLVDLYISRCSSLTALPSLPNAGALERLHIYGCSSLTDVSSLTTPLPLLTCLTLWGCISLRELPSLTHLTSLTQLRLQRCSSLRELPNLTHLTSLKKVTLDESFVDTPTVREKFPKEVTLDYPHYY